ncbi:MAG: hypothetical protein NTV69_01955 [Caldilinea sp.]|nr:hypothetical protein [Caldilinea sp.]
MSLIFRDRLLGGNRTSVGDSQDVINELERSGERLNEIYSLFFDEDPVVVMRSSYVAMKYAEINPHSVAPFKQFLLENLNKFRQQELRWHIPQLFNYIVLSGDEVDKAYLTFMEWAEKDNSTEQLLQPDSAIVTKLATRFAQQVLRQCTPRRLSKC